MMPADSRQACPKEAKCSARRACSTERRETPAEYISNHGQGAEPYWKCLNRTHLARVQALGLLRQVLGALRGVLALAGALRRCAAAAAADLHTVSQSAVNSSGHTWSMPFGRFWCTLVHEDGMRHKDGVKEQRRTQAADTRAKG